MLRATHLAPVDPLHVSGSGSLRKRYREIVGTSLRVRTARNARFVDRGAHRYGIPR